MQDAGAGKVVAGRYALRRVLGTGGMGQVWLASDAVLGREVAVKEVTFPAATSAAERDVLRERTLREARAAARFQHPQATTVHDVVEEDGKPWIVMEHVPSRSLSEVLREAGPLAPEQVARIGLDVLAALTAAHAAGIVHRDVKPANVLVGEQDRAWLTDFGIATSAGDTHLTGQGVLLGSPSYIAPERVRGEEPTPASDLWALGATLFTALEGRPPFDRGEPLATLLAVADEAPPPAGAAGPLRPLVEGLLVRDPAARTTAEQARQELAQVLARPGPAAPRAADRTEPPPEGRRGPGSAEQLERIDLDEVARLAAAATRAVAGSAARKVARRADARRTEPRRTAPPRRPPAPSRPAPPPAGRPRWRFKRRWVVVPVVVTVAVVAVLLTAVVLALAALVG